MHSIRIGTCGSSYQDWSGVFYPKGLPAGEYLAYVAEHYPIVEVDSTFYRSPSRKMVEGWRDKTPDTNGTAGCRHWSSVDNNATLVL